MSFAFNFALLIIFNVYIFFFFQDKLQLVSVLGAGLLVGTALAVIIPEGIRALFSSTDSKDSHGAKPHESSKSIS